MSKKLCSGFILGLVLSLFAPYGATQEPLGVPVGAERGLFLNLWFEPYLGQEDPVFQPAPRLVPNTNYLLVMDISTISYQNAELARPGALSLPLPMLEPNPGLIAQVVIDDETYLSQESFFVLPRHRGVLVERWDWQGELEQFSSEETSEMKGDAFTLLATDRFPAWVIERESFPISVRDRVGGAPLAIVFRDFAFPEEIAHVVSTRFCVDGEGAAFCGGLPRRSEHLESEIAMNPPPLPAESDIRGMDLQMAAGESGEPSSWTWNGWTFVRGDPTRSPVPVMVLDDVEAGVEYTLEIDAARLVYSDLIDGFVGGDAEPDPTLQRLVENSLDRGLTTREFTIRAESLGSAVEIADRQTQRIVVDLTKLDAREPLPDVSGATTVAALSHLVAATRIEIPLAVREAGCGTVAISITDTSGIRPLDHLLHQVEVVESAGSSRRCVRDQVSSSLTAGLGNLLNPGKGPPVDVALHIFEQFPVNGTNRSAVFLYGIGDEPHSWYVEPPISQYLGDARNLQGRIDQARERSIDNGEEHAYGPVGSALASAIFSGANRRQQKKAEAASDAFRQYVRSAAEPPTFLVRFTDRFGDGVLLPFGLLAAPGAGSFLDAPLDALLPLPTEDHSETGCLEHWSVAVSDRLEGAAVPVPAELKQHEYWLGPSFEDLRRYLTDDAPADQEGFVIVAHHNGGRIRYASNDVEIQPGELTRAYGEATVGVFAMCEAGGANPVDRALYERLNSFGLDAAILSPFSLDANYGKAFAIEFSRVVREAVEQGRDETLLALFNKAVAATAAALRDRQYPGIVATVGDMGLELILAGNPNIRLCKNRVRAEQ